MEGGGEGGRYVSTNKISTLWDIATICNYTISIFGGSVGRVRNIVLSSESG